jgi:hypothetical protein
MGVSERCKKGDFTRNIRWMDTRVRAPGGVRSDTIRQRLLRCDSNNSTIHPIVSDVEFYH